MSPWLLKECLIVILEILNSIIVFVVNKSPETNADKFEQTDNCMKHINSAEFWFCS